MKSVGHNLAVFLDCAVPPCSVTPRLWLCAAAAPRFFASPLVEGPAWLRAAHSGRKESEFRGGSRLDGSRAYKCDNMVRGCDCELGFLRFCVSWWLPPSSWVSMKEQLLIPNQCAWFVCIPKLMPKGLKLGIQCCCPLSSMQRWYFLSKPVVNSTPFLLATT
jgi:hypothetical protein